VRNSGKKRQGNRWDDHYARQARDEKWRARSVYKLEEIDNKFKIIKKGHQLLDLGCYPGSWSQYAIKKVGIRGEVVGIDLRKPAPFLSPKLKFFQADVSTLEINRLRQEIGPVDVVMSDLAPQTTGIRLTDAWRSMELAKKAAEIAFALLRKKGHFICKVFEGEDLKAFKAESSVQFKQLRLFRPKATRKGSREVYLIGLNRLII